MTVREVRVTTEANLTTHPATRTGRSGPVLKGYAAVFGSLSEELGGFREKILPGAFADSLKKRDVLGLYGHDYLSILGRTRNGSLLLREDARGLHFELHLPATRLGEDLAVLVADRTLSQMSFGFSVPDGGDHWTREGARTVRVLNRVTLYEVSLVAEPAYPQTSAALRDVVAVMSEAVAEMLASRRQRLATLESFALKKS